MILSKFNRYWWRAAPAIAFAIAACVTSPVHAQSETVLIKRPAQLRDAPGETSRTLVPLAVQTSVTRLGDRQGPWIKVRLADGTSGWIHMFDVASASSAQTGSAGAGALRSITSFFNKGSAQANASSLPTSTVGIRGLGAEDLANAQPNLAAVAQADSARVDAGQARLFASSASLSARNVEPLPAPAPPAASGGNRPGNRGNNNDLYKN
jgi:Bacterial SH3 domain